MDAVDVDPERALPDFIIAGSVKAGTTALWWYLRQHPRIFMSRPKEPNFFCEDFPEIRQVERPEEYRALFRKAEPDRQLTGEASPRYLYSRLAPRKIREHNPETRIVVMVRNPVEMIHSFHSQLVLQQIEPQKDFSRAWSRDRVPDSHFAAHMRYREVGRVGTQLERLLEVFPRKQVRVVVFDDFTADTRSVYRDVLDFLGVPDDGRTEFPPINRNKELRSEAVASFVRRTPSWLEAPAMALKRMLGISKLGILERIQKKNVKVERRDPLPASLRAKLASWFREDVERLSKILDRDLTHWVEEAEEAPRSASVMAAD